MTTDGVTAVTDKKTGLVHTQAVANDQMTNEDFLKLMIEQIKNQDPTKPMNSKEILNSQMQMSAINTNKETIKAMQSMSTSFHQSAISSATSMIGKSIENGDLREDETTKAFTVRSIENKDGKVELKVQEIDYMKHAIALGEEKLDYNKDGEIFDSRGKKTGNKILLEQPGVPKLKDGKLMILDKDNKAIDSSDYAISVNKIPEYKTEMVNIPLEKVTKVFEM